MKLRFLLVLIVTFLAGFGTSWAVMPKESAVTRVEGFEATKAEHVGRAIKVLQEKYPELLEEGWVVSVRSPHEIDHASIRTQVVVYMPHAASATVTFSFDNQNTMTVKAVR